MQKSNNLWHLHGIISAKCKYTLISKPMTIIFKNNGHLG